MIYLGISAIDELAKLVKLDDPGASSHWRKYHKDFKFDGEKFVGLSGFGGLEKPHKGIKKVIYNQLQKPFREIGERYPSFNTIDQIAIKITKAQNKAYDLDVLRQAITLAMLFEKIGSSHVNTLIIGDGFATMTSLICATNFSEKIILINLTKTLLVDIWYVRAFLGDNEFNKKVALITSSLNTDDLLSKALNDDKIKIIAIEAKNQELIKSISIDVAINIASMQEMAPRISRQYIDDLRLYGNLEKKPLFFYCCNRVEKHLPGGEVTRIKDYGWQSDDEVILDELCSWHQKYYSIIPPFYRDYDGAHWNKLVKLKFK